MSRFMQNSRKSGTLDGSISSARIYPLGATTDVPHQPDDSRSPNHLGPDCSYPTVQSYAFDALAISTMTYPMLEPTTNHLIQYSIEQTHRSVHLRIWEPKAANKERLRPFLFAVNYFLETEEEAYQFLRQYLRQVGGDATQVSRHVRRGELRIVPMPTEDIDLSQWG